jgi:hypothetical protein
MDPAATPGEIFVPRKPSGTRTRLVTDGKVTREVQIIGRLGPAYEVFDIQNGGHGEIYFCVPTGGTDLCSGTVLGPPVLAGHCRVVPRWVGGTSSLKCPLAGKICPAVVPPPHRLDALRSWSLTVSRRTTGST